MEQGSNMEQGQAQGRSKEQVQGRDNVKPGRGDSFRARMRKLLNTILIVVVLGLALFIGVRYYYPYGEGVKSGQLNYVVYKGLMFKTYEGKLIQSGFWTDKGGIQSNYFEFSIIDPAVADSLMRSGGKLVELHYKEYLGTLPWRGYSRYVVDSILSVTPVAMPIGTPPPVPVGQAAATDPAADPGAE